MPKSQKITIYVDYHFILDDILNTWAFLFTIAIISSLCLYCIIKSFQNKLLQFNHQQIDLLKQISPGKFANKNNEISILHEMSKWVQRNKELESEIQTLQNKLDQEYKQRIFKSSNPNQEQKQTPPIKTSSQILVLEESIKSSNTIRMALRASGISAFLIDKANDVFKILEANQHHALLLSSNFIDLVQPIYERFPDLKIALNLHNHLLEYVALIHQINVPISLLCHHNMNNTLTKRALSAATFKFSTQDIFGIQKYLNWGTELHQTTIQSSLHRKAVIDSVEDHFRMYGIRHHVLHKMAAVLEELLMNAIYDAPIDYKGNEKYNHYSRLDIVQLERHEYPHLTYGCDGNTIAISISDPFGRLDRNTLLTYLQSRSLGEEPQELSSKSGAGWGLYQIMQITDHTIINMQPNVKTEVIALFQLTREETQEKQNPIFDYFEI